MHVWTLAASEPTGVLLLPIIARRRIQGHSIRRPAVNILVGLGHQLDLCHLVNKVHVQVGRIGRLPRARTRPIDSVDVDALLLVTLRASHQVFSNRWSLI